MTRPGPIRLRDAIEWGFVVWGIIALAEAFGWVIRIIGGAL